MHGYDWKALGERYRALLPHVAHRSDLNYVLGEMVAELNVGHAYIEGGDYEIPPRPKVALPGARFELDRAAGPLPHREDLPRARTRRTRYRSPLTEVGVDATRRRLRPRDRRRRSCRATTIPTGCCATRPIPSP